MERNPGFGEGGFIWGEQEREGGDLSGSLVLSLLRHQQRLLSEDLESAGEALRGGSAQRPRQSPAISATGGAGKMAGEQRECRRKRDKGNKRSPEVSSL